MRPREWLEAGVVLAALVAWWVFARTDALLLFVFGHGPGTLVTDPDVPFRLTVKLWAGGALLGASLIALGEVLRRASAKGFARGAAVRPTLWLSVFLALAFTSQSEGNPSGRSCTRVIVGSMLLWWLGEWVWRRTSDRGRTSHG